MKTGICVRCGAVGDVEADHPAGRHEGKPVFPKMVDDLCRPCHILKGRMDRAAGVEGGKPTIRLILGRYAVWFACLASTGEPIVMPAQVVADVARVLAILTRQLPPGLPFEVDG